MGDVLLAWVPRGEAGELEANLSDAYGPRGLQVFRGGGQQAARRSVSAGGAVVTLTEDHYFEYDVQLEGISIVDHLELWQELTGFMSHAQAGGEFKFKLDGAEARDHTTSAAAAAGATVLELVTAAGWIAGDKVYIEDVDDPTKWQVSTVGSKQTSPPELQGMAPPLFYSYGLGSVVRSWEYFPKCVAQDGDPTLEEREAGRGANLWDFRLRFRTVRS